MTSQTTRANAGLLEISANPASTRAFTLTELLIVITIMILLMAVAVPNLKYIVRQSNSNSAQSITSALVASARPHVSAPGPFPPGGSFKGAAVVFTANDARVVKHSPSCVDAGGVPLVEIGLAGYDDVGDTRSPPEYMYPLGLVVLNNDSNVRNALIAPPFAVKWNRSGQLVATTASDQLKHLVTQSPTTPVNRGLPEFVFYNKDYDFFDPPLNTKPKIDVISSTRLNMAAAKKPLQWKIASPSWDAANMTSGKITLPFDQLEGVLGIVWVSLPDMPDGMAIDWIMDKDHATYKWAMENHQPIFFNRYTGQAIGK